ncbi:MULTISPECIES: hypothetical protein [unclassified Nocardioides]|uniref:hypothetical protein n=1 Tax=unclassified Nocardioides TaxID=2615069 RepID=UPI00361729E9
MSEHEDPVEWRERSLTELHEIMLAEIERAERRAEAAGARARQHRVRARQERARARRARDRARRARERTRQARARATRAERRLAELEQSTTWRVGRAMLRPAVAVRRAVRRRRRT